MKRIATMAVLGLGLAALTATPSSAVVVRAGYAHTSVHRTTVVRAGCCYGPVHPVARTAAVVGAVAVGTAIATSAAQPATVTTVAVGTIVPALPGGCATVQINGITYHQCSGVYYRPYYQGTTLVYQVSKP